MKATRTSNRLSTRVATYNIRRVIKSQTGRRRLVINVSQRLTWVNNAVETRERFMDKKSALLVNTMAISDGTFVQMFAFPDHATDEDYILNEAASRLNLESGVSLSFVLDDDEFTHFDNLVHGPVLLIRVDEDGQELGLNHDNYKDLCELYNI